MTLTELRYIVMLAKEQHFGRAAERCFVSQPTLSIAVKKLEEELAVALFERSKNRVKLTPVGSRIVQQAQRVLEETAAIKDIALQGKNQLNSPLTVGAIFTVGPYLFPHMIPQLQKIAPDMPLIIEEGYTATLRKRLRNGELDVIIISLPFAEPDVVTQPIYDEHFVALMRADNPLSKEKKIALEKLDQENLMLLGEGHCFREQILETSSNLRRSVEDNKGLIRTAAQGSSLETLRHMVASGMGVTILPSSATHDLGAKRGKQALVTRPFTEPAPSRTIALAWRASFPRHQSNRRGTRIDPAMFHCGLITHDPRFYHWHGVHEPR